MTLWPRKRNPTLSDGKQCTPISTGIVRAQSVTARCHLMNYIHESLFSTDAMGQLDLVRSRFARCLLIYRKWVILTYKKPIDSVCSHQSFWKMASHQFEFIQRKTRKHQSLGLSWAVRLVIICGWDHSCRLPIHKANIRRLHDMKTLLAPCEGIYWSSVHSPHKKSVMRNLHDCFPVTVNNE